MEAKRSKDFVKTFEIEKDGKLTKFVIKLVPKDRYEEAADHMCNFFLRDEPLSECENVKDDPEVMQSFRNSFITVLEEGISIAAFVDNPQIEKPVMASINVIFVGGKGQKNSFQPLDSDPEKVKKIMNILVTLSEVDTEKLFGCDRYIAGYGLSVDPAFRGNSIGYHMLKARHELGEMLGIPLTVTLFTSPISTKLGLRAGFEVISETSREEVVDANGQLLIPTCTTESFKIMALRLY